MTRSNLEWKDRFRCAIGHHDKMWSAGIFGPDWECRRCGKRGDLEEHSRMGVGEHLMHLAIAIVVVGLILLGLRQIF